MKNLLAMEDNNIHHRCIDKIVCPYCGHEDDESYMIKEGHGIMDCESCDEKFYFEREENIVFSTQKIQD